MERKDLFDEATFDEIVARIQQLTAASTPEWGQMSVAQMLAHAAEVQDVMNGKPLKGTPFLFRLIGPLIKRLVVDKKTYKRNLRTHPQYEMTDSEDFETQKDRLIDSIRSYRALGKSELKHPIFGRLSAEERGWAAYKHLNHHLSQFGV
ncbi:MAG: DUF1569 domain-containing protein [Bacteroidetes Order II. Incertae sedis bacterium]|jgi:hypothetical protein|nr:DUF1569 domain-containing protein [Bacteroidetes Order II. bacterium]MBT5248587.1 DUF1569 domain-containing protein [Bacteroidetes Order II. bacterium]MBT7400390.1 DUF1569 domain-containing protein [Bacteroidetes Order II. bacterium]